MRLGVITTNFPPARGGMQEHARGLVTCLAREHVVSVFVRAGDALAETLPNVSVTDRMTWDRAADLPELRRADVEAWLVLDAGLADYLLDLQRPGFVYVHGNDSFAHGTRARISCGADKPECCAGSACPGAMGS